MTSRRQSRREILKTAAAFTAKQSLPSTRWLGILYAAARWNISVVAVTFSIRVIWP